METKKVKPSLKISACKKPIYMYINKVDVMDKFSKNALYNLLEVAQTLNKIAKLNEQEFYQLYKAIRTNEPKGLTYELQNTPISKAELEQLGITDHSINNMYDLFLSALPKEKDKMIQTMVGDYAVSQAIEPPPHVAKFIKEYGDETVPEEIIRAIVVSLIDNQDLEQAQKIRGILTSITPADILNSLYGLGKFVVAPIQKLIDSLIDNYHKYYKLEDEIRKNSRNGVPITNNMKFGLTSLGNSIKDNLIFLINFEEKLPKDYKNIYNNAAKLRQTDYFDEIYKQYKENNSSANQNGGSTPPSI